MGPPTDPRPSGSARVPKWSVRPWLREIFLFFLACNSLYREMSFLHTPFLLQMQDGSL
ncbi:unnamed protein product [Staurois parvus]|uniref:Uncharacterized protein n=1 Tax=Staurois parvus TaxID=386267 RepID=A0ABN9HDR1_9NEOB|nr:unnamed protein product [Staurois parvus]